MTDTEYIKQLEDAVIFLSGTYLKALDAMRQFPNAIMKFPVIQGTRNTIAMARISELELDRSNGFQTLAEEMIERRKGAREKR